MSTETTVQMASLGLRVAEELRALMGRRKVTGTSLAKKLGVSQAWISYRLNGQVTIDLNDLSQLSEALGVDPSEVVRAALSSPTLGYPAGDRFGTVGPHVRPRPGRPPSRTDARRMDDQRTRRRHRPVGR